MAYGVKVAKNELKIGHAEFLERVKGAFPQFNLGEGDLDMLVDEMKDKEFVKEEGK